MQFTLQARRRPAEERDELASSHSITSSARSIIDGGTARPGALAVLRFTVISNFCRKTSVYQLVRENQQVWRNLEAELFSGFQIDDEIKFIWVSDRQVGRFYAFEDFTHKTHRYFKALL